MRAGGDRRQGKVGRCDCLGGSEHGECDPPYRGSEVTFYRWRQEFSGLKTDDVKRLKDLQLENSRLRKAVSDLTLDKLILAEATKGSF
jgi:Transposase